jgi:cytochrome c oxidase subunit 2
MLLSVTVDSAEDFDAWVRGQQEVARGLEVRLKPDTTGGDETALAGKRVFETTACINCHAIRGTVANGRYGPDLTHFMSRKTLASGAVANTTDNLRLWIENPEAIKPGSLMPAMKLNDADLDALVRYMGTLQ